MALRPDTPATDQAPTTGAASALRGAVLATLAILALSGGLALLITPNAWYPDSLVFLTLFCAERQDLPVAAGIGAWLALAGLRPVLAARAAATPAAAEAGRTASPSAHGMGWAVLAGLAVLAGGIWLIRTQVLFDHDFTRDEHMAVFDARIFAAGRLFWPFPPAMIPFFSGLNDLFLFPIGDREGLVSGYLPVNAAIRALLGQIIPLSLVSPVLVGLGGLALWRIAERLWPGDRATQGVVLLGYAGSSQVVLIGTAAFAMTTHLAFNLIWLALFLRGTRAGHAGALLTGLLATGIHQPLFHPLFVLPFLDLLRRQGRWRTLALYCGGYLVIGLVWLAWPHWLAAQATTVLPAGPAEQFGFLPRIAALLTPPNVTALCVMAGNLLRFITWQHVLLVPLALVGTWRCAGRDDLARALAWGLPVTFVAMLILLPPQGHGWGYRYLHGLIGNLCLLGGFGWRWLRANGGTPRRALLVSSLLSFAVLLPVHAAMVRTMIAPYARAAQAFARLDADYVVVDSTSLPFGTNFVLNRPDLSNRPRLLLGSLVFPADLARLCPGRTIAFADAPAFAETYRYYQEPVPVRASSLQEAQKRAARRAGCTVSVAPIR
ncbi:hypothetical protein ACFOON_08305 [Novosphingobium piscinae]|uniref:Glycosyltransferase RgtA/B/C/D-like domain-containing protein n=1 Tax=Novosphingobium piscinae TaxID=1507448 RepID=A0A7X1FZE2_9SPHN|nr:hypothetical protein [Novosphingobium piscinae]MBC2669172.1 hypothetical protein [Novosphingobium piscinae]